MQTNTISLALAIKNLPVKIVEWTKYQNCKIQMEYGPIYTKIMSVYDQK